MSVDGVLYCLTNKSTLYALDASSGVIKWQQSLDGATGSATYIKNTIRAQGTSTVIQIVAYLFLPNFRSARIHCMNRL